MEDDRHNNNVERRLKDAMKQDRARLQVLDFTQAHLSPWSRFGEPWPTGATAMWAAGLLLAYLFLAY